MVGGIFLKMQNGAIASHLSVCVSLQDVKLFNSNLDVVDDAFGVPYWQKLEGRKRTILHTAICDLYKNALNHKKHENHDRHGSRKLRLPCSYHFHFKGKQIFTDLGLAQSHLFTLEQNHPAVPIM